MWNRIPNVWIDDAFENHIASSGFMPMWSRSPRVRSRTVRATEHRKVSSRDPRRTTTSIAER